MLTRADLARLDWLPDVARAAGAPKWAEADVLAKRVPSPNVLTNGESSTFIVVNTDHPAAGNATVEILAVAPSVRRLGIGGRTVLALERRLRKSATALYVQVPSSIGLALYFWLRLGYRPLTQTEWPASPDSETCAWMKRDLA